MIQQECKHNCMKALKIVIDVWPLKKQRVLVLLIDSV